MSRTRSIVVVVSAAVMASMALPAVAYADVATAGSCTTTYAVALESDVLVNGPVHGGGTSGGDFTPSIFLSGATTPTQAFVACAV
jgi:hypothetical protein